MTEDELYFIGDVDGFTPQIGRLVSMMRYTRITTVAAVEGLSVAELDHRHDEASNSIGALLTHVAAVEAWYQAHTFFGRELDADETRFWAAGLDLGDAACRELRGRDLEYYVGLLESTRARTLEELRRRDDGWLEERGPFGRRRANNYFMWFHVTEDELSHRGQIRWLRKRLAQ